jgi:putative chitinase
MSYRDVMNAILPPTQGKQAHITGHYGEARAKGPHGGSDFNYTGGQSDINLRHPAVHSPIAGKVVFVGGNYGTVTIRDRDGNEHKLLHMQTQTVQRHQLVEVGQQIGTMGGRGPGGANDYAQHVHYQMKDHLGRSINPETFWAQREIERPQTLEATSILLKNGDRGESVRSLQSVLSELGYRDANGHALRVDGDFGDRTEAAVKAFQQAHGLHVDGKVGRDTREALEKAPLISERTHPHNALFQQAKANLEQLPPETFRSEAELDRAGATLALSAKQAGISHIDHVMLNTRGDGLIAIQGSPQDPGRHLASVDKMTAISQSLERSTASLDEHVSAHGHAQAQAQMEHVEHRAGLSIGMRP